MNTFGFYIFLLKRGAFTRRLNHALCRVLVKYEGEIISMHKVNKQLRQRIDELGAEKRKHHLERTILWNEIHKRDKIIEDLKSDNRHLKSENKRLWKLLNIG